VLGDNPQPAGIVRQCPGGVQRGQVWMVGSRASRLWGVRDRRIQRCGEVPCGGGRCLVGTTTMLTTRRTSHGR